MKNKKILKNLIYLTILLIPFYLVKVKIWIFPTNILEILIGFLFLVRVLSLKKEEVFINSNLKYKKYIFWIALIFLGLILAAIFNGNNQVSWGIIKSWFFFPLLFIFLAANIIPKEKISNIFLFYFLSAVGVSLISLSYFFFGKITYDGRLAGVFNSPNYLAMYLAPALIIALENFQFSIFNFQFIKKDKTNKTVFFICLAAILTAIYFTYSYAAWISIILVLIIIVLIKKQVSLKNILIIAGIIVVLFFSQLNNKKLNDLLLVSPRSSLASRIMIWKASLKMIENNFWLGIGSGNFQKTYLEYQKYYPPYLEWAVPHPNNLYLTIWLYSGMLGFVGFLGLIISFFYEILGKIKKEPSSILFMALGIMLVILIHGFFDTTYFKNDLAIVFWLNFLSLKL